MRRVGIDGRLINQTGVGVYIRNLLFYLSQKNVDFLFYIYLLKNDFSSINFTNKNFVKKQTNSHWHSFGEQISFLSGINNDHLDLMHFTYFSYPVFYRKPFIATVHDLTPLLFKTGKASTKNPLIYKFKHYLFQQVLSAQISRSQAIITPCEAVKKQIVEYFGSCFSQKIYPIYEGVDYEIKNAYENSALKNQFKDDFFIYVGNFYPHKNIERLVRAFSEIKTDVKLILLGPDDFFTKHMAQLVKDLNQSERIIFFKNPHRQDLVFFYKHALGLIHPSLSEGFGLPILEAVYFGCPIIGSNINVFKEILGSDYLSFDPNNIQDISSKIQSFLEKKIKPDYQGIVSRYSFEKMSEETLKLYHAYI